MVELSTFLLLELIRPIGRIVDIKGDERVNTAGENIRIARERKKLSQVELAKLIGVSNDTVSRWETGKRQPRLQDLNRLAEILEVSFSFVAGKTNETTSSYSDNIPAILNITPHSNKDLIVTVDARNNEMGNSQSKIKHELIALPLLTVAAAASCGAGNGLYGVDQDNGDTIMIERDIISQYDESRKPFALHTEGDSMINAGIGEGSVVIINPAAEVVNGNSALVVYNDKWFIKWIVFNPDGSIELRSANNKYTPIYIDKEYAKDPEWFRIVGKVVQVIKRDQPKDAF